MVVDSISIKSNLRFDLGCMPKAETIC